MTQTWTEATKAALLHYSAKNQTLLISRQLFIEQELASIVKVTKSKGATPTQTLSRILQELRDESFLYFSKTVGEYTLSNTVMQVDEIDLPDDALENALKNNLLAFKDIQTHDALKLTRVRRGTNALRNLTLKNYGFSCALCDIDDSKLLVTSHIIPWAREPLYRGLLDNVICLCTLHDKLFEVGYFSVLPSYALIWRKSIQSKSLTHWIDQSTVAFKVPKLKAPRNEFLQWHNTEHNF